jgi:hypothetical protein
MANLQSDNMTVKSARLAIAILGMSRCGAAPTDADRVNADGTLKNKRPLPNDGEPDDTASAWVRLRD